MPNKPIRVVEGTAQPYQPFWTVRDAAQTGGEPEIDFNGYISEYSWMDDEVTPKKFKADLYSIGKGGPVTIRMHSGGGEIWAAAAIRAMLLEYPGKKTVTINGLCASAAVAIALACDVIKIYDTSYMMVHNPGYGFLMGYLDAETLQKFAQELQLFREGILNAYETRTKLSREELAAMCDAETWMTAQLAVEKGFADEVITGGAPLKNDQQQVVRNYVNVPPALINSAVPQPETESGQVPAPVKIHLQEARVRLEQVAKIVHKGALTMNIRELLKDRETLVARAQSLTELADKENRDLTPEERQEFEGILGSGESTGKVGELDAKIEQIQGERAKLVAAAEKKFSGGEAEKPAAGVSASKKRAEFDKLSPSDQTAFIKGGGKVED